MAKTTTNTSVNINNILSVLKLKECYEVIFNYFEIGYPETDTRSVRKCNPALSVGWGNLPNQLNGYLTVRKNRHGSFRVHVFNNYIHHSEYNYVISDGKIYKAYDIPIFEYGYDHDYDHYLYSKFQYDEFEKNHIEKMDKFKIEDISEEYLSTPLWEEQSKAENYLRALLAALRDVTTTMAD